ncbi:MAG TPA: DUF2934 domain-containing protein [Candidatus Sulfotelmatobacter sp.]|nr:DUF2934 domain-containing protein [Candidatus Sulfotelmatobacter sp.]
MIPLIGEVVDIETRRKKQQALLVRMVERRVRSRAQQLYESRGQGEGHELQDWFQAESEVLENKPVAPLYRRVKSQEIEEPQTESATEEASPCEAGA